MPWLSHPRFRALAAQLHTVYELWPHNSTGFIGYHSSRRRVLRRYAKHPVTKLAYLDLASRIRKRLLEEMRQIANEVASNEDAPRAARFSARAALAYSEGSELSMEYLQRLQRAIVPAPWDDEYTGELPEIRNQDFREWTQKIYSLIIEAQRAGHPLAIADAYYALGASNALTIIMIRASEIVAGKTHPEISELIQHTLQAVGVS